MTAFHLDGAGSVLQAVEELLHIPGMLVGEGRGSEQQQSARGETANRSNHRISQGYARSVPNAIYERKPTPRFSRNRQNAPNTITNATITAYDQARPISDVPSKPYRNALTM